MNQVVTAVGPMPEHLDTVAEQAEYVGRSLTDSIAHLQHNRDTNKRRASVIRIVTIFLSGAATVLLGLQIPSAESILKQVAFFLGACVTMLNALEPFFNFRSLWVEHERALASLYRVEADLGFYLTGRTTNELDSATLEDFHIRHQQVWEELSAVWLRVRTATKGQHDGA